MKVHTEISARDHEWKHNVMLKIGEFSKICRVPTHVLRYYADIGLLAPAHVDPFTGYRYYTLEQLPQLNRVLVLKALDLSLEQIKQLLNEEVNSEEIRGMLRLKQSELRQEQQEIAARLAHIQYRLTQIEQEGKMPDYEVIIKSVPVYKIASIRKVVPTVAEMGAQCGAMFDAIAGWIQKNDVGFAGPCFAIYYNEEYTEQDIDVENAFIINPQNANAEHKVGDFTIEVRDLPALTQVASTVHNGDFAGLTGAWQALGTWIEQNDYAIVGASREIYLSAPGEAPVAEIQYPVKKR